MAYYRIDAIVEVVDPPWSLDPAEAGEAMGDLVEYVLESAFDVRDLSVYQIVHMPTDAERKRETRQ